MKLPLFILLLSVSCFAAQSQHTGLIQEQGRPGSDSISHQTERFETTRKESSKTDSIQLVDDGGRLSFQSGNKSLLSYQYKTLYPPPGTDSVYKRSGFIHPLWTPNGQELTRIQPPDHYHHYGIWNPWTRILFENDTLDFWNLHEKKGTVRFAGFQSTSVGPFSSEFTALHEHVAFKKNGTEKIALNETQTVRVHSQQEGSNFYIVDIISVLSCASESPVKLLTYRYGGLGWRATAYWNKDNCEVLTSEGKNRANTDGTRARWCLVQGALPNNDHGGMAILSHPKNYNHPEPIRIWNRDMEEDGSLFFNFSPIKDRDWQLEPGNEYRLRYRLVVFNGTFSTAGIEKAWKQFAEIGN